MGHFYSVRHIILVCAFSNQNDGNDKTIEGLSSRKHRTAILERKKMRFWHQANCTNKRILLTKKTNTEKHVYVDKVNRDRETKHTVFWYFSQNLPDGSKVFS